jgi:GntR family transcriptional regulator, transcriptional repressor for pyruvate dehydrogenase complex
VREVVRQLASAVQRGDLRLGDRLPVERAMADHLGVSRMTIRKALDQLRDAGVLQSQAGRGRDSGSFVSSEAVPVELLVASPLEFDAIVDALEARRMLEPQIAQMAGARATESDLAHLREILYEQIRAGDDLRRVRELDPSFHIGIARATHNTIVVVLMQTLLERLELTRNPPAERDDEARRTVDMHHETIDAIASRDPIRIESAMRRHLRMLESAWETHTGRSMPDWPPALNRSGTVHTARQRVPPVSGTH